LWAFASIVPGIVPVHGMIEIEGRPFIIMTGVLPGPRGETNLGNLFRTGPLPLDEAVFFASAIAKWLSLSAHVVPGLVHGDLTPANVLIRGGVPWISDFDLARVIGRLLSGDALTGTRAYSSPLARDPKALLTVLGDVYSFGVILEQMVTGVIPGRRRYANRWHISASSATTQVRDGLLALAECCQAKDPALRPCDFRPYDVKHLKLSEAIGSARVVERLGEFCEALDPYAASKAAHDFRQLYVGVMEPAIPADY
jgi:serine/threonine protein kinase